MNTPAHVVLNLLVLGRPRWASYWPPILLGSILPDTPMFLFYLVQKGIVHAPEHRIWSHAYFEPAWQLCFDVFNSLPLVVLGLVVAGRSRSTWLLHFFLSMGLHSATDLLVHNVDAHRHLLPFSTWRFSSPVSYWDPQHRGEVFLLAETALVFFGSLVLVWRHDSRPIRLVTTLVLTTYAGYAAYAFTVWRGSAV